LVFEEKECLDDDEHEMEDVSPPESASCTARLRVTTVLNLQADVDQVTKSKDYK